MQLLASFLLSPAHFKIPKLFPNFAHAEIKLLHPKLFGEYL
jgi:hypothetical protein